MTDSTAAFLCHHSRRNRTQRDYLYYTIELMNMGSRSKISVQTYWIKPLDEPACRENAQCALVRNQGHLSD